MADRRSPLVAQDGNVQRKSLSPLKLAPPEPSEDVGTAIATAFRVSQEVASAVRGAAQPPPVVPTMADGPVECIRKLGAGGFGSVWLGRQMINKHHGCSQVRRCAVKLIPTGEESEEGVTGEDVAREVAAHERLFSSPTSACRFFLRLHNHVTEIDRSVLVLELFEAIELLAHTANQPNGPPAGWLDEKEARVYAAQLIEALEYAHARGVAHLDLKPQNVLVRPSDGKLKLIDYGAAVCLEGGPAEAGCLVVEDHGGTPNYMSPERHFEDYDDGFDGPAADVYSWGCVLFFMLRGHPPYDWDSDEPCEVCDFVCDCSPLMQRLKANDPFGGPVGGGCAEDDEDEEDEPPRPPLSVGVVELVKEALRLAPEARPSASALRAREWLAPAPAEAAAATGVTPAGRTKPEVTAVDELGDALCRLGV